MEPHIDRIDPYINRMNPHINRMNPHINYINPHKLHDILTMVCIPHVHMRSHLKTLVSSYKLIAIQT
jgi:hypothetical protein